MPNAPTSPGPVTVPDHYRRLTGSERRRGPMSTALGPADPATGLTLTLFLRRRTDGLPAPDLDHWRLSHPAERRYLTVEEYEAFYGASPADLAKVADFLTSMGLTVSQTHGARRRVIAAGTVASIEQAFAVALQRQESPLPRNASPLFGPGADATSGRQTHHSYEGHVHLPADLAGIVTAVFGLDDRKVVSRNLSLTNADPLPCNPVTVPLVCELYGWPYGAIPGQTVGLIAGSIDPQDITDYYANLNASLYNQVDFPGGFYVQGTQTGMTAQTPPAGAVTGHLVAPSQAAGTLVLQGSNQVAGDEETSIDVCLASSIAQGATMVLYFQYGDSGSYAQAFSDAILPAAGEPKPTVVSTSFAMCTDDPGGMYYYSVTPMELWALSEVIAGAAAVGVTVCAASGDSGVADGSPGTAAVTRVVQYPASDPGVLGCGATTIGTINGRTFDENLWSDQYGVTGGGVSNFFNSGNTAYPTARQPSWQAGAGVPVSLNDGSTGRGVPDVAANGGASGYHIYTNGQWAGAAGTSAATPVIAGLIAQLNAELGFNVGFLNTLLYAGKGSLCRKISNTAALNAVGNSYLVVTGPAGIGPPLQISLQGYPGTASGWDACTGWGVFDWDALVATIRPKKPFRDKVLHEKPFPEKISPDKFHLEKIAIMDKVNVLDTPVKPVGDGPFKPSDGLGGTVPGGPGEQRLARLEDAVKGLGEEIRQLRAFIRPEERPPVGAPPPSKTPEEDA